MKTKLISQLGILNLLIASLIGARSVQAQITGINATDSQATNAFVDLGSYNGGQGGGFYATGSYPWDGTTVSINQPDGMTGDSAVGSISATLSVSSPFYSVDLNGTLTQQAGNTGEADLIQFFDIDYEIGSGGLSALPVSFPNFLVSGTVQNTAGSYAAVSGEIDYYDGANNLIDQVSYSWTDNTPGNFYNVPVNGHPTSTDTPALDPYSHLYVNGYFDFTVDPGSLSIETIPEPSSLLLALAGVCSLLWRRLTAK